MRYLRRLADEVVCLSTPEPFRAVGLWYDEFSQTTDEEVKHILAGTASSGSRKPGAAKSDPEAIVREKARPLKGDPAQYDALIEGIGDARVVLLGEATHGTHEFYRERAFITRRLITEKGFTAVAVEADWPDAYRINRFVRGTSTDEEAIQALADFGRFPTWMWRNADVLDFVGWLLGPFPPISGTAPIHRRRLVEHYGLAMRPGHQRFNAARAFRIWQANQ